MKKAALIFLSIISVYFLFAKNALALTVASQTTGYETSLNTWQVLQELGDNLSGTVDKFTFRVSTSVSNTNQFDFTVQNTKIYDKTTNSSPISACAPSGSSSDPLAGLTFSTSGVPSGYQDVTLDFSCRDYSFVSGRQYLIFISNSTMVSSGGLRIQFASTIYQNTSNDNFTGGGLRYAHDNETCSPSNYIWNSSTASFNCNIFTTTRDDLYFILTNTTPSPTSTPTPTATPTSTPSPTPTLTPTSTPTPTPTSTPTPTPTPTNTPTPTPTLTPTPTQASSSSSSSSDNQSSSTSDPTSTPTPTITPKPRFIRTSPSEIILSVTIQPTTDLNLLSSVTPESTILGTTTETTEDKNYYNLLIIAAVTFILAVITSVYLLKKQHGK